MNVPSPAPASGELAPLVTVVVVSYNGVDLVAPCLRALAAQNLPRDRMQVWVVDNASGDGTQELIRRDFPWVRLFANERNAGFAGGNNVALRQVDTPYVALLNQDARPTPDWLRRLLEPFEREGGLEGSGEPDVGARAVRRGNPPRLAATTSKIVFMPRFLALHLSTTGTVPGTLDTRELGVRISRVTVDGEDVTEGVLWDHAAYGPEGYGDGRFRWTRPSGQLLVPLDQSGNGDRTASFELGFRIPAEVAKPVVLTWAEGSATIETGSDVEEHKVSVPGARLVDVLNNAGSVVFMDGYGADRGYQEVDRGQFDRSEEVFAFCGASVLFRTAALREAGVFDDDFFMYYEDTDLAWRLRALGWSIRYLPDSVVRHIHAASSEEWSPFFTFHVDRNRLLLLTKNARAGLAAREVLRYPVTTASLALRTVARARNGHQRPPLRPTLLRAKVMASYLRLLPAMLNRRWEISRRARVDRRRLQRWLVLR
jgi:GT2 family glycosyltransferase